MSQKSNIPKKKKSSLQLNPEIVNAARTIHIYLTLLGLMVMLGFGITGFTANHEDWFGATQPLVTEREDKTPIDLIQRSDALRIVEHIRSKMHVAGALDGYDDLEDRISLGFKSPGEVWEIDIEKQTGKTMLHHEAFNSIAFLNNLHRGRYAGRNWSWLIDVSAILIVLACITGFILWLTLPRRRKVGLASIALGMAVTYMVAAWFVPGRDLKLESKSRAAGAASRPSGLELTTTRSSTNGAE